MLDKLRKRFNTRTGTAYAPKTSKKPPTPAQRSNANTKRIMGNTRTVAAQGAYIRNLLKTAAMERIERKANAARKEGAKTRSDAREAARLEQARNRARAGKTTKK